MRQVIDLGWCVGTIENDKGKGSTLRITSPSYTESSFFEPAQTIVVCVEFAIKTLRDALTATIDAIGEV